MSGTKAAMRCNPASDEEERIVAFEAMRPDFEADFKKATGVVADILQDFFDTGDIFWKPLKDALAIVRNASPEDISKISPITEPQATGCVSDSILATGPHSIRRTIGNSMFKQRWAGYQSIRVTLANSMDISPCGGTSMV